MNAKELEERIRFIATNSLFIEEHEALLKIADDLAHIARKVIAAENMANALRIIAYGPFPEDLDSPEAQVNFDNLIARTALAAWEAAQ